MPHLVLHLVLHFVGLVLVPLEHGYHLDLERRVVERLGDLLQLAWRHKSCSCICMCLIFFHLYFCSLPMK